MTKQLTIFGTLEADFTVKPWVDPGCTRVYPETRRGLLPAGVDTRFTGAVLEARMTERPERVSKGPRLEFNARVARDGNESPASAEVP